MQMRGLRLPLLLPSACGASNASSTAMRATLSWTALVLGVRSPHACADAQARQSNDIDATNMRVRFRGCSTQPPRIPWHQHSRKYAGPVCTLSRRLSAGFFCSGPMFSASDSAALLNSTSYFFTSEKRERLKNVAQPSIAYALFVYTCLLAGTTTAFKNRTPHRRHGAGQQSDQHSKHESCRDHAN